MFASAKIRRRIRQLSPLHGVGQDARALMPFTMSRSSPAVAVLSVSHVVSSSFHAKRSGSADALRGSR
jgi:hypothetical protein